ncbi:MAG: PaaX family transcriptional regulator C-terminal domain-containing protein [Ilumatobacteraceae bacterium]
MTDDHLPARRGGAKALLLTVLGEFVLPAGGAAWTSTLVSAAEALGIAEKNARQALSRIADQGLIEPTRHGRQVRWSLTADGRTLLETGAARIYSFGTTVVEWDHEWLIVHCAVPEAQRPLRDQLRTRLSFLGFGELSASLMISPHSERDGVLRATLGSVGLLDECTVLRSRTAGVSDDRDLARQGWDLEALAAEYGSFSGTYTNRRPETATATFAAVVELVHGWRRFPFLDPELPLPLLPTGWAGARALADFGALHGAWSGPARRWFAEIDASSQLAGDVAARRSAVDLGWRRESPEGELNS